MEDRLFFLKYELKNGKLFKFYKLRSIHIDAHKLKDELMEYNETDGSTFKIEKDSRITKAYSTL